MCHETAQFHRDGDPFSSTNSVLLLHFLNPTLQAVGLQQGSTKHLNHKWSESCSCSFVGFFVLFCFLPALPTIDAQTSHVFVLSSSHLCSLHTQAGKVNFKLKETVSFVCFVFWISNPAGGAVYPCTDAQQNQTLFSDLRRYLSSQGVVVVVPRRPGDRLFCCVIELSPVQPLCLLYYISKSHRPTCAAMTVHP